MKTNELMTKDVYTCSILDNLNRAAQLMWEGDVGCVPVVDDAAHVVGMITDRDICMAAYTKGKPIAAIPVSEVMAKQIVSCSPGDELSVAERLMQRAEVRRLPVVRADGRLVGILSLNDLARQASRERGAKTRSVGADEVAVTLAAICKPRAGASPEPAPAETRRAATLLAASKTDEEC